MPKTITNRVFLTSGVGNSIFQYLYAAHLGSDTTLIRGLNEKNILTKTIGFDIHKFDLRHFPLPVESWNMLDLLALALLKIITIFAGRERATIQLGATKFHFGYFQRFPRITLKSLSMATELLCLNGFATSGQSQDRVLLHVRHGDFDPADRLQIDYYVNALHFLLQEKQVTSVALLGIGAEEILEPLVNIFGDALEMSTIPLGGEMEDVITIAQYKYVVCSNSTFCFWAAMCGHSEFLIVPHQLIDLFDLDEEIGLGSRVQTVTSNSCKTHA